MKTFTRSQCRTNAVARQAAFSLIELLIVVTIIMILAGLLLPALRGVREKAKSIACMANMRDIGNMLMLYEQEYSAYPGAATAGDADTFVRAIGGQTGTSAACPGSNLDAKFRPLNRYISGGDEGIKKYQVFHCPSDIGEEFCGSPQWEVSGTSYHYVCDWGDCGQDLGPLYDHYNGTGRGFRRASIVAPARKVVLFEPQFLIRRQCDLAINLRHNFRSSSSAGGGQDHLGSNVLFADGGVRFVMRDKFSYSTFGGHPADCTTFATWPTNTLIASPEHDWY